MLKFDLTEIESSVKDANNEISELMYQLSIQTSNFVNNIQNLTVGLKPGEGQSVFSLSTGETSQYISDVLIGINANMTYSLNDIYRDSVFQYLVATDNIPVAWISRNSSVKEAVMDNLLSLWEAIVNVDDVTENRESVIYPYYTKFGLLGRRVEGHSETELCYFLVYNNQNHYQILQNWYRVYGNQTVIIISEKEYQQMLVADAFTFIFEFNKVEHIGTCDVTLQFTNRITETIPTYVLTAGIGNESIIIDAPNIKEYPGSARNLAYIEFNRGESVTFYANVPVDRKVAYVALDGVTYYVGSQNITTAGITVVEQKAEVMSGFRMYTFTISGLTSSTKLYVGTAMDRTNSIRVDKVIDVSKSLLAVGDSDVKINLVFNNPFLWFNQDRMFIYGKKTDEDDFELIDTADIIVTNAAYVKRYAIFKVTPKASSPGKIPTINHRHNHKPSYPYKGNGRKNPYVDYGPMREPIHTVDNSGDVRKIEYNVSECGAVIINLRGYTDYKYFTIKFGDYAVLLQDRHPYTGELTDIIPRVEQITFTNNNPHEPGEVIPGPPGGEEGNPGGGDSGDDIPTFPGIDTSTTIKMSPGLGISYTAP